MVATPPRSPAPYEDGPVGNSRAGSLFPRTLASAQSASIFEPRPDIADRSEQPLAVRLAHRRPA